MKKNVSKKLIVIAIAITMLSTSMVANAAENYTVKSGDYLKKIAKEVYGDASKWELIYEANKDNIKNPNLIYEGQIFVLPDTEEVTTTPATEVPATDETPVVTEVSAPTETPVNTTMSMEEAMQVWNNFWNDPNQCLAYFDDTALSFFDKDNDQTINQEEHDALMRWVIYANDTNTDNNTADAPLDNAETIAMATKLKEGNLVIPNQLFNVDYVAGLWLKY